MRALGVLGIGLYTLAATGAAMAATTTYYHAGDWRAFSGTDAQNRLICGMATGNPSDGRSLEITLVIGDPRLQFAASKPTWDIPPGTTIPVLMKAGGGAPWTVEAAGQAHTMTWTLSETEASAFDGAFRGASQMSISFPSGNEPPWGVLLEGSTATDDTFRRCIQDYTARAAAARPQTPTQPFGAAPTQPFAPPIAATPLPPSSPVAGPGQATQPEAAPGASPPLPPIPSPSQPAAPR